MMTPRPATAPEFTEDDCDGAHSTGAEPTELERTAQRRRSAVWRRWPPRFRFRCGGRLGTLGRSDAGRVTAFTAVIAAAVLLFSGLVLDGGLALAAKVRAVGEAQEAARAGAQAIDLAAYRAEGVLRLDPDRAAALARDYVASSHPGTRGAGDGAAATAPDTVEVTVAGDTVTVTVTAAQPTRLLALVGVGSIRIAGTGVAHPDRGPDAGLGVGPDLGLPAVEGTGP